MTWNWELSDWPKFTYDPERITSFEEKFLQGSGASYALFKHLSDKDRKDCIAQILTIEGLKSSKIEGELLDRDSLNSSIRRHFGLKSDSKQSGPKEDGMAALLCDMYDSFAEPLTHQMLFKWHHMLMSSDDRLDAKGSYRSHEEPMQIVSGRYGDPTVHFEAPPSKQIKKEMDRFILRFNEALKNKKPLLGEAALLHVYFEAIHPFEDGNGRIGRALVEKFLSQRLAYPTLIAVSQTIQAKRKEYYRALGDCNRTLAISPWTELFAEIIVESQKNSTNLVNFLLSKSRIMNNMKDELNERQEKALLRMFAEGPDGFQGGLSADNYIAITKTSRATATRDLADLVSKEALKKTGQLRHTRYWLNIDP